MEIKLEQVRTANGSVFEAEAFEAGQPVFVVAEEGSYPVTVGTYEMEDGATLIVEEEGVIASYGMAEEEVVEEEMQEENKETATPKKVVESISTETHFSKDMGTENTEDKVVEVLFTDAHKEAIKEIVVACLAEINSQEETQEEVEETAEEVVEKEELSQVEPIKHSPEAKGVVDFTKFTPLELYRYQKHN